MKLIYLSKVKCNRIDPSVIYPTFNDVTFTFDITPKIEVVVFQTLGRFEIGKEYTVSISENESQP